MLKSPFLDAVAPARNILIAGIGGGYDVFTGLPLYFGLQADGKQVHLANLSFSALPHDPAARLAPTLLRVTADTDLVTTYFPEQYLAQWFRARGQDVPVYCFERTGVRPLLEAYRALVAHLENHLARAAAPHDLDGPAVGTKLERVVDDVAKCIHQGPPVAQDRREIRRD